MHDFSGFVHFSCRTKKNIITIRFNRIHSSFFKSGFKRGEILLDGIPQPFKVHGKITVNEPVPHPRNIPPRDIRVFLSYRYRYLLCRFTNYLKGVDNGILFLPVIPELLKCYSL